METVAADVARETDAGLLVLIGAAEATSDADQALALEARREFHRRHYGYVLAVLNEFAFSFGTVVIDPEEFAAATFRKAFRVAGSFEDQSGGDPAKSAAQVRAYLGRAASRLARDELDRISRRQNDIPLVVLDEARDIPEPQIKSHDAKPTNPRALAAVRKLLNQLKPKEHDILMTDINFGVPKENGRELPTDVREALECRTGYERSTVRQRWHRLSLRLKTQLQSFVS